MYNDSEHREGRKSINLANNGEYEIRKNWMMWEKKRSESIGMEWKRKGKTVGTKVYRTLMYGCGKMRDYRWVNEKLKMK